MRRKAGQLIDLEVLILKKALTFKAQGQPRFHGFHLATELEGAGPKTLIPHGTMYKALSRLEEAGLLARTWEDPEVAEAEGRPRRKYYWITAEGQQALYAAHQQTGTRLSTRVVAEGINL